VRHISLSRRFTKLKTNKKLPHVNSGAPPIPGAPPVPGAPPLAPGIPGAPPMAPGKCLFCCLVVILALLFSFRFAVDIRILALFHVAILNIVTKKYILSLLLSGMVAAPVIDLLKNPAKPVLKPSVNMKKFHWTKIEPAAVKARYVI
jgi:hypothetical protein